MAKEEALSTGAYFGKTMLGIGNDLEDDQFEVFREWAEKQALATEQARAAIYSGVATTSNVAAPSELMSAEAEDTGNGSGGPGAPSPAENELQ